MSIIKPCCDCPETFLELNDTPDSYLGQRGKFVAVKSTEDGLEFVELNISANQILFFNTVQDLHLQDTIDLNDNQIAYVKETNNFYYLRKNGVNKGIPYDPLKINVYSSVNGIWVNMNFKVIYFSNDNFSIQDGLCPETAFNINVFNNIIIKSTLENLYIYYEQSISDAIKKSLNIDVGNVNFLYVISPDYALRLSIGCNYIENFYISYGGSEIFEVIFLRLHSNTINNLYLDGLYYDFEGNYKIKNVSLFENVSDIRVHRPFDFVSRRGVYHNKILSPTIATRTNDVYNYSFLLTYDTNRSFTLIDNVDFIYDYISTSGSPVSILLKYKIHYDTTPKYFNILNDLPFNKRFSNGQYFELILKELIKNIPECCYEYDTTRKKYILRPGQVQYFTVDRSIIQNTHIGAILLNIIVENRLNIRTDTGDINDTIVDGGVWYVLSRKEFETITNNIDSYFTIENPTSSPTYFLMKLIYLYL
jgi:hypothetical protein